MLYDLFIKKIYQAPFLSILINPICLQSGLKLNVFLNPSKLLKKH